MEGDAVKSLSLDRLIACTLLPILGAVAGAFLGVANAYTWHAFDFSFPILSAAAMALIGFFALGFVIEKLRLPHPWAAMVAGLAFGIVSYGAYRYADYLIIRNLLPTVCFKDTSAFACPWASPEWSGFVGYLKALADQGIEVLPGHLFVAAEMGAPVHGAVIRGGGLWGLWFGELAFVTWLVTWGLTSVARQPFCDHCGRWFAAPVDIGRVPRASVREFLDRMMNGDLTGAGSLVIGGKSTAAAGELTVLKALCPGCSGAHVHLSATRITKRPQGMFPARVISRVLSNQDFAAFSTPMA